MKYRWKGNNYKKDCKFSGFTTRHLDFKKENNNHLEQKLHCWKFDINAKLWSNPLCFVHEERKRKGKKTEFLKIDDSIDTDWFLWGRLGTQISKYITISNIWRMRSLKVHFCKVYTILRSWLQDLNLDSEGEGSRWYRP